jgi:hypothetical protein
MKYMTNGGFRGHPLMRLTLGLTLVFLAGLWLTNGLLYFARMGLDPASVVRHYRGSEEDFIAPRTYGSMLEVTHFHLPMMAMVLLLLTHLAIFLPWRTGARAALIVLTFAFALLGEASGWLVRFVDPRFAVLKIVCFLGLEVTLAVLIVALAVYLFSSRSALAEDPAVGFPPRPTGS